VRGVQVIGFGFFSDQRHRIRRGAKPNCAAGRVHMIKLTKEREAMPYGWVHPDEGR